MKKNILLISLFFLLLTSCNLHSSKKNDAAFISELKNNYPSLSESTDIHFQKLEKTQVETFLQHGTGILFFGFPECPWCQHYLPLLNEQLAKQGLQAFYYNIYIDKKEDAPFYDKIAQRLEKDAERLGKNLIHYSSEGRALIYMPLTLFVEDGVITYFESETNDISAKEYNVDTYWTKARKEALFLRNSAAFSSLKKLLDAKKKEGCENACGIEKPAVEK